jgi:hypothetical protein
MTLPALIASELDAFDSDELRARRVAELVRMMAESFPDTYDARSYRSALHNAAADLEADAETLERMKAEAAAADDYYQRLRMKREAEVLPALLAEQCQ